MSFEIPHVDTFPGEEFLPFQKYYVSNMGRVWSNARRKFICEDLQKTQPNGKKSYKTFGHPTKTLHHAVMQLFGPVNKYPDYLTDIDHINRDWHDNRISNLRWLPHWQNNMNTNAKGWGFLNDKYRTLPYQAQIQIPVKCVSLGMYATPEEAHEKYCEARERAMKLNLLDFVVRTKESIESFVKTDVF